VESDGPALEGDLGAHGAFRQKILEDLAAAATGALAVLGDRLGLYRALAEAGPLDSVDLARRTRTSERYVREWLFAQASVGYVDYDPESERFALNEAQRFCLAGGDGFAAGGFEAVAALWRDEPRVAAVFRSGQGLGWHEHHPGLDKGWSRALAAGFAESLTSHWIPAVPGLADRLTRGGAAADVGRGDGAVAMLLARAFPALSVAGFGSHGPSIERSRERARQEGLEEAVRFEGASAHDFPGQGYTLVTCCHHLHDLGDPVSAVRHMRRALAPGGVLLLVEPHAGDALEPNGPAAARLFYAVSVLASTPASRSEPVGACLGAQAGEARLRHVLAAGGFSQVDRVARDDLHLVLAARR
jgi:SAM-dependent methyltransferase